MIKPPTFSLQLACNNPDNGSPTGRFEHAELHLSGLGDTLLSLYGPETRMNLYVSVGFGKVYHLRVGRIIVPCGPEHQWYGSWVWNRYDLRPVATLRVLAYLRKRGFEVEHGESRLFRVWEKGERDVSEADLTRVGKGGEA